jgi:hypothetical protein
MKRVGLKSWRNRSMIAEALEFEAIGQKAVTSALSSSFRKNIPLAFEFREMIYYLLPNGEVSLKSPWRKFQKKK